MIRKEIITLLEKKSFITISTCAQNMQPNAAPKFLLDIKKNSMFLVDYTISKTWRNIQENAQVSISVMDEKALMGYQLNGKASILDSGALYDEMFEKLKKTYIRFIN